MIKSKQTLNISSPFSYVIIFATLSLLSSLLIVQAGTANLNFHDQINNVGHSNVFQIDSGLASAFAQSSETILANSDSTGNNSLVFNNYENSEMGISIKYPSNFLIDESNSNETVKQVTLFPAYDDSSDYYPPTYISWFDIYVEELYPPISDNPINISSYLKDQANAIQEENADVTIIKTSIDSILSGYPAYELVTRSYSGNTSIDNIEIGTIVGNKLYILSYEVNTNDVQNSLPVANKMIYSFKINSLDLADSLNKLTNSTSLATIKNKMPFLEGLLSSLSIKNLTNNPYSLLNSLDLNETTKSTIENILKNSSIESGIGSIPTNFSSLLASDLRSINPETLCNIQLLSSLCKGDVLSQPTFSPFLSNESSLTGFNDLFNLSRNTTTTFGNMSSIGDGVNLSELKNLLGPFAMLSSSPSASPSSSSIFGSSENASNPLADFGLSSLLTASPSNSSASSSNSTSPSGALLLLNQLLLNSGFGGSNINSSSNSSAGDSEENNQIALGNDSSFNPFQALFGTNGTGIDHQLQNHSSLTTNTIGNSTLDLLNMLQFLQGSQ